MKYKKTILIIDDMKQIRDILWFSLKKEGYKPILAENGPAGLKYLFDEENEIDLVILDVMMPKMDGFEVLGKLRTSNNFASKTPVIMLTAKAQKDDVIKGLNEGANDYVLKPYKFTELLIKVQNLIG
ncbi:MAG: response regulator transcription factor [Desulfobacteraceae bacterium]|nr:response regulator transcription factor [Desulfobacteraceae bacterium]